MDDGIKIIIVVFLAFALLNSVLPVISSFTSTGDIAIGTGIVNRETLAVRDVPAGSIIGKQEQREFGTVKNGPEDAYGSTWWLIDYTDRPSGWVDEAQITSKITAFVAFNSIFYILDFLRPIGIVISIILILFIIYIKIKEDSVPFIGQKEEEALKEQKKIATVVSPENIQPGFANEKWNHIQALMRSYNVNDWRQAIIEADVILEEMLEKIGYDGMTIGDKLKNVEPSDFNTLNQAWEAHKVRNKIAHEGSSFAMTKDEAERAISMYEEVFKEFFYI